MFLSGWTYKQSASYIKTVVGLASPILSSLKIDKGIKLILGPNSHNVLLKYDLPIGQRIDKFAESFNLDGNLFTRIELHSLVHATVSNSPKHLFLVEMSFSNLA